MDGDMTGANGEVRLSANQVYQEVLGMKQGLGRIEASMDRFIALQEQTNSGTLDRLEGHSGRLGRHDGEITGIRADLTQAQTDIRLLKEINSARDNRRTPWWIWITATGGLIAGLSGVIGLWLMLDRFAGTLAPLIP